MQQGPPGERPFEVVIDDRGIAHVCGDLDDVTIDELCARLAADRIAGIDLSRVTFINLNGLRVLAVEARRRADAGVAFSLRHPSRPVRRLATLAADLPIGHLPWDVVVDGPQLTAD